MRPYFIFPDTTTATYNRPREDDPHVAEKVNHYNNPVNLALCRTFNKGSFRYGTETMKRLPLIRFVFTDKESVMWIFEDHAQRDAQFEDLRAYYEASYPEEDYDSVAALRA